jgi:hypothetical protein
MNGALACNTEGECTGCSVHAECGLPSCSDGVLVTPECSGGGCIEKQKSCEAYACDGEHACHASCTGHAQCAPGFQCKSGACAECTTCADWFDGEYPYEYCEGSDSVTTLFEGCGCATQECAYACATTLCSSPVMLQPDAGCRSCLEIACPWAVSECKKDVRAGQ